MNIEFICPDPNVATYWHPKPAKECIPDKILNLPTPKDSYRTTEPPIVNLKACLPVMDYMSAGYIMFNAFEVELEPFFQQFKENLKIKTAQTVVQDEEDSNIFGRKSLAIFHDESCPNLNDDKKRVYFKFRTMWGIKTPPGYSCLVMQPFYLPDGKVQILPGIVDTDTYHLPIPVTGYLKERGTLRLPPGTPVLQVIPFKRDDWEMSVSTTMPSDKSKFFIWNSYKRLFHKIKQYI